MGYRSTACGAAEDDRGAEVSDQAGGDAMTYGSLFSGIGGGDLGLDRTGMVCAWQIERDRQCNQVLAAHWPDVPRYGDIMEVDPNGLTAVDLIIAGDPCPCRSYARGIHGSKSPDLFPAVVRFVSALRPRWVLRENVVANDVDACAEAICRLGYAVVVAEVDSAQVTGQSRPRQYLLGVSRSSGLCPVYALSFAEELGRHSATGTEAQPAHPCLSTRTRRFDARDGCVIEPVHPTLMTAPGKGDHNAREAFVAETLCAHAVEGKEQETHIIEPDHTDLRILSAGERERLQGFPVGWTAGHSFTARCRMLGNAMTVPVVEHFGRAIKRADGTMTTCRDRTDRRHSK